MFATLFMKNMTFCMKRSVLFNETHCSVKGNTLFCLVKLLFIYLFAFKLE